MWPFEWNLCRLILFHFQFKVHRWDLWKRLYQYTEEEREIRLQTYFKFLFVREPLKRLLSAYKDKFIGNDTKVSRTSRSQIVKAYRPQDLNKDNNSVSFPEFIRYFSNDIPRNQHWRQYEKLCHPCLVNYSFIGHLETLEQDAPLLLKMAGIDDRVTFPPIHSSTNSSQVLEYYSQVPAEYITQIGKLYRSDFEMFGYEYLGQVKPLLHNITQAWSERSDWLINTVNPPLSPPGDDLFKSVWRKGKGGGGHCPITTLLLP